MEESYQPKLSEKHLLKTFFYMMLPIFAVIAGMNILFPTPDSEQYKGFYNLITDDNILGSGPSESHFELGFSLSAALFKLVLQTSYYTWVIFIVGISLLIKFFVFQQFRNGYLVIVLYIMFLYTSNECIVVRASIASSICLWGCLYLDTSKIKAMLLFVAAVLFHNSTTIFLLMIFVPKRVFLKKINFVWFVIVCISLIILKAIIIQAILSLNIPRVAPYIYDNPRYFNIWGLPRNIISIASVFVLSNYIKSEEEIKRYLLNIAKVLVLISTVTFDFSLMSIRFLDLALPLIFILLLDKLTKNNKYIICTLIFLMSSELFFTRIIDGPGLILDLIKK